MKRTLFQTLAVFLCFMASSVLHPLNGYAQSSSEEDILGATRVYEKGLNILDPIAASNGAYFFSLPLLSLGGPMDLHFKLFYRSDMSRILQAMPENFW